MTPLVEYWTGSARLHLWIMLGASLLLLIASVISSSNLLLSRTLSRRPEIATRLALGARRGQILAQLGDGRRTGGDRRGGGGFGRGAIGHSIAGQVGAGGHSAIAGGGFGSEQLLFRRRRGGIGCGCVHVVPGWAATRMHLTLLFEKAVPGRHGPAEHSSRRCSFWRRRR